MWVDFSCWQPPVKAFGWPHKPSTCSNYWRKDAWGDTWDFSFTWWPHRGLLSHEVNDFLFLNEVMVFHISLVWPGGEIGAPKEYNWWSTNPSFESVICKKKERIKRKREIEGAYCYLRTLKPLPYVEWIFVVIINMTVHVNYKCKWNSLQYSNLIKAPPYCTCMFALIENG